MSRVTLTAQRALGQLFGLISVQATDQILRETIPAGDATVADFMATKVAAQMHRRGGSLEAQARKKADKAAQLLREAVVLAQRASLAAGGQTLKPLDENPATLFAVIRTNLAYRARALADLRPKLEESVLRSFPQGRKILQLRADYARAELAAMAAHYTPEVKKLVAEYAARHGVSLSQLEKAALGKN